jgi:perosamine synthetase
MYGVVLSDGIDLDAEQLAVKLRERGVATRPFFLGMHEQPVLQERGLFAGESYPVAERLARRGLYLPTGLTLTDDDIGQVCDAVREVLS